MFKHSKFFEYFFNNKTDKENINFAIKPLYDIIKIITMIKSNTNFLTHLISLITYEHKNKHNYRYEKAIESTPYKLHNFLKMKTKVTEAS